MDEFEGEKIARILGIGFGPDDGHIRITHGEDFEVYQGSQSIHDQMQTICMMLQEKLREKGLRLSDLNRNTFKDLISEIDWPEKSGGE